MISGMAGRASSTGPTSFHFKWSLDSGTTWTTDASYTGPTANNDVNIIQTPNIQVGGAGEADFCAALVAPGASAAAGTFYIHKVTISGVIASV